MSPNVGAGSAPVPIQGRRSKLSHKGAANITPGVTMAALLLVLMLVAGAPVAHAQGLADCPIEQVGMDGVWVEAWDQDCQGVGPVATGPDDPALGDPATYGVVADLVRDDLDGELLVLIQPYELNRYQAAATYARLLASGDVYQDGHLWSERQ